MNGFLQPWIIQVTKAKQAPGHIGGQAWDGCTRHRHPIMIAVCKGATVWILDEIETEILLPCGHFHVPHQPRVLPGAAWSTPFRDISCEHKNFPVLPNTLRDSAFPVFLELGHCYKLIYSYLSPQDRF